MSDIDFNWNETRLVRRLAGSHPYSEGSTDLQKYGIPVGYTQQVRIRRRHPLLAALFALLVLLGLPLTVPWAFHIGGRWTPLLNWWGSGTLLAKGGIEYPIFVNLHPSAHFSRLRLDGQRPTGGVQGSACLCTSPGVFQYLKLTGTIYGGWLNTEGSLMGFRLVEPTIVDVGQGQGGYFDLVGRWHGQDLVMDDRGGWSKPFRSGLRMEHASVTLHWSVFWTCKAACASAVQNH